MRYLIALLILYTQYSYAQQNIRSTNLDSLKYAQIESKFEGLEKSVESTNNIISVGNTSVANQLSITNLSIAILGAILAIVGVGLGVYFNRIESRVKDIEQRTQEKLDDIIDIEERIKRMQFDINNNISKIYRDLQNAEIVHLLKLLEEEPVLMANFHSRLMSFDIDEQYFTRFYKVYVTFKERMFPVLNYPNHEFLRFLWRFFWKKMILISDVNQMSVNQIKKHQIIDFIIDYSKKSTILNVRIHVKGILHNTDSYRVKELTQLLTIDDLQEVLQRLINWTGQQQAYPEQHATMVKLIQDSIFEHPEYK